MVRVLVRRLAFTLTLVFVASSAAFFLTRLAPGDYVTQSLGATASNADAARLRARLGLDRSPARHYAAWLQGLSRLSLGASFADDRPVTALVVGRALNTALLAFTALFVATLLGVAVGTWNGSHAGSWLATLAGAVSLALVSMPPLLTTLLLMYVAAHTRWFPVGGMRTPGAPPSLLDFGWHMVVPVLALALPVAASLERIHARAVDETLREPYLLAARARGASERSLVWRAALKPSLRSLASVYGLAAAALFSGSFAVEALTAWPGLGRLLLDALRMRDVPLVAGCVAAGSLLLAVASMCSDALLVMVDPRAAA